MCFHSYVEPEKLNGRPWGRGRGKIVTEREANHKRLLNTENKLRVDGREGKMSDGHCGGHLLG